MADQKDVHGTRIARTELSKRGIDSSRADIRVVHGVCYIKGLIIPMAGSNIPDIRAEMEHIRLILRQKPDIRDVVVDCQFPGAGAG